MTKRAARMPPSSSACRAAATTAAATAGGMAATPALPSALAASATAARSLPSLPVPSPLPAPRVQAAEAVESDVQPLLSSVDDDERRVQAIERRRRRLQGGEVARWLRETCSLLVVMMLPAITAWICHAAGFKEYAVATALVLTTIGSVSYLLSPITVASTPDVDGDDDGQERPRKSETSAASAMFGSALKVKRFTKQLSGLTKPAILKRGALCCSC